MYIPQGKINSIACMLALHLAIRSDQTKSNQNITYPPVNPTTANKPAHKPTTVMPPFRLVAELLVAKLGFPVVVLAPLLVAVVCGLGCTVTTLVNVDFGGVLAVVVLKTTDVVAFWKRAVVDVSVRVEADDVEVPFA